MSGFDVILGKVWLSSYQASIDYFVKTVNLRASDGSEIIVATSQGYRFAELFLAYIEEAMRRDLSIDLLETRVVSEYQDVFQDIPELPPV